MGVKAGRKPGFVYSARIEGYDSVLG